MTRCPRSGGRRIGAALAVLVAACAAAPGAQILTENAGVTSPEVPTLNLRFTADSFDDLFDVRAVPTLYYGLDPKTELKVETPVVLHRDADFTGATGQPDQETWWGIGDVGVRVKRSLAQTDGVMASTRFATMLEMTVPTGRDDVRGGGVSLPRKLQISSGAPRFGGGLAASVIRDRHRFSADAWFRHPLRHDGIRLGETIDAGFAYWFRLHPAAFDPEQPTTEIRPVIEVRYLHQFASVASGRLGDDGDRWIVAPGIQIYPAPSLLIEANARLPIAQTIDDPRGDFRWGALVSVKILF